MSMKQIITKPIKLRNAVQTDASKTSDLKSSGCTAYRNFWVS